MMVTLAMVLKKTVFVLMVGVFSDGIEMSASFLLLSAISAVGTGLMAPPLFFVLGRLSALSAKDGWTDSRGDSKAFGDWPFY
jgi:hypothetical protein